MYATASNFGGAWLRLNTNENGKTEYVAVAGLRRAANQGKSPSRLGGNPLSKARELGVCLSMKATTIILYSALYVNQGLDRGSIIPSSVHVILVSWRSGGNAQRPLCVMLSNAKQLILQHTKRFFAPLTMRRWTPPPKSVHCRCGRMRANRVLMMAGSFSDSRLMLRSISHGFG